MGERVTVNQPLVDGLSQLTVMAVCFSLSLPQLPVCSLVHIAFRNVLYGNSYHYKIYPRLCKICHKAMLYTGLCETFMRTKKFCHSPTNKMALADKPLSSALSR